MKLFRITNARGDVAYYLAPSHTDALILASVDGHTSQRQPYGACEDITDDQLAKPGAQSLTVLIGSGMNGKVDKLYPEFTSDQLANLLTRAQAMPEPIWQFTGPEVTQFAPF